jgi:hypothetical protein
LSINCIAPLFPGNNFEDYVIKAILMKLLKKVTLLASIACFMAGITCPDVKAKDMFGFYYGDIYSAKWNDYEKLVIDIRNFSQYSSPTDLSETNARLITYLSIGQTDTLIEGDKQGPGGYASWYLDQDGNDFPDQNPDWGSYYVDANSNAWHDYVLQTLIPELSSGVISGLFLDTLDTVDIYPETTNGMIALVNKIRLYYPDYYIVQNRGLAIINETAGSINALLFEGFSTYYDFDTGEYKKWSESDLNYLDQIGTMLNQLKQIYPIDIWTLDYREEDDNDLLRFAIERAVRFGFTPSTTDIFIKRLDLMNLFFIYDNLDINIDRAVDITEFRVETPNNTIRYYLTADGDIAAGSDHYQIFISTHNPVDPVYITATGFSANYMIEDGCLYKYNGDVTRWSWTYLRDVVDSILNNTIVVEIDPSFIETGDNTLISAMAATLNFTWAVRDMTKILRGVTAVARTDNVFLIEDEINKSIRGHQDIKRLTSTDSVSELFVEMTLRRRPKVSDHYIIFIDTDGAYDGYRNYEITASHMVMDGELYRYSGDGDSWDWVYIKTLNIITSGKKLTYTLDKLDVELVTGAYSVMGEVLNHHWNDVDHTGTLQCSTNY